MFGKIPAGVQNILTEIFDPLQKLTTVIHTHTGHTHTYTDTHTDTLTQLYIYR